MEENELFDSLISSIVQDKGGDRKTYTSLLDTIAYHETGGTMDPKQKQIGGGPGRGKYQYEPHRLQSSAVRLKRYLRSQGKEVPTFVKNIINGSIKSADMLEEADQDALVLGDLRMKGGLDLADYAKGNYPVDELWADHWWQGPETQRAERLASFNRSYQQMNKLNSFNEGGTHDQSPIGGVPFTQNAKVEEGETSIAMPDGGHFVFSNQIMIPSPLKNPKQ